MAFKKPMPVCRAEDYVPFQDGLFVLPDHFLVLPGAITENPEEDYKKYNAHLLEYMNSNIEERAQRIFERFKNNPRIRRIVQEHPRFQPKSPLQLSLLMLYLCIH